MKIADFGANAKTGRLFSQPRRLFEVLMPGPISMFVNRKIYAFDTDASYSMFVEAEGHFYCELKVPSARDHVWRFS